MAKKPDPEKTRKKAEQMLKELDPNQISYPAVSAFFVALGLIITSLLGVHPLYGFGGGIIFSIVICYLVDKNTPTE